MFRSNLLYLSAMGNLNKLLKRDFYCATDRQASISVGSDSHLKLSNFILN